MMQVNHIQQLQVIVVIIQLMQLMGIMTNASAVHMDEHSLMLSILEELDLPSEKESLENSTQATDSTTDDVNSHSQESVESRLHGNGKHTGKKPFECSYCGKKYGRKHILTTHLRIHTGVRPYKCICCDKTFRYKMSLTRHLQSHTGEKPFECSYCDKKFGQKSNLTMHLRIHTGKKLFQCSYCDKKFFRKGNLTSHLRIHTRHFSTQHHSQGIVAASHYIRPQVAQAQYQWRKYSKCIGFLVLVCT